MLSDDHYRAKLQQTIAAIKAWTGFVADVARVEEGRHEDAWRLELVPHVGRACAIGIMLRDDRRFDLELGAETYQDCELDSLEDMLPLVEAVVEGRVILRTRESATTGLVRDVSTVVRLADGTEFELGRHGPVQDAGSHGETTLVRDLYYLPYRR